MRITYADGCFTVAGIEQLPGVTARLYDVAPDPDAGYRLTARRVTIDAPSGVTPTLLRQIPLGAVLSAMNRDWSNQLVQSGTADAVRRLRGRRQPPSAVLTPPATSPYPDTFY